MAQSDDFDITLDGALPSDLKRPGRTRRRDADIEDFAPKPANVGPKPVSPRRRNPAPRRKPAAAPDYTDEADKFATEIGSSEPAAVAPEKKRKGVKNWAIVRFFTDDRTRLFLGLTLLLLSVFMVVALFSHIRYGGYDQSVVENTTVKEVVDNKIPVKNAGGAFGAWLSHALLVKGLGLGSLALIVYAFLLSLALFRFKKCNFWSLTFKTLLVAITVSVVLGLATMNTPTALRWGGDHGHYINLWVIDHANMIGAVLLSVFLIGTVVCVYFNELKHAWRKWTEAANRYKLQQQLQKEKERELESIEAAEKQAPAAESAPAIEAESTDNKEVAAQPQPFTFDLGDDEPAKAADAAKPANSTANEEVAEFVFDNVDDEPDDIPVFIEDKPVPDEIGGTSGVLQGGFLIMDKTEIPTAAQQTPSASATAESDDEAAETDFSVVVPPLDSEHADEAAKGASKPADAPEYKPFDHRADLSKYKFPPLDLLVDRPCTVQVDMEEQKANKDQIVKTLADYNIQISRIEATVGPTVTLYEIVPAEGVRISQIKRLEDDIALSLAAEGIRIIAPMPGKGTVGIEVPNKVPQTVSMRSVLSSRAYQENKMALPMALGATVSNEIFIADMAKMPHLLVAGATGMGKSVGLNAILASLLYKKHPTELKLVLIDPKMVEFSLYSKLERHYLAKLPNESDAVITEPLQAIQTLNSLCIEMDDRYGLLKDAGVRTLEEYNKKFSENRLSRDRGHRYLPYIVVIVDEFSDLIMLGGKEVDAPIMRIGQKARAVGIHLIIATQRPSTTVITGNIKANFPGRMAFRVIQMEDSRTILGAPGANRLIGRGDMLFSHNANMERVQCAFISTEEVQAMTDWIDEQVGFEQPYYLPEVPNDTPDSQAAGNGLGERDPLFDEAARYVVMKQVGSTSSLQRQFNIGYNRAGRLMDQMCAAGIIGPVNGAKPRAILVDAVSLETILSQR